MLHEGKADYTPGHDAFGNSYGERLTFVGKAKSPLWIGKRKDIPGLFSEDFWTIYDAWRKKRAGYGLPWGELWPDVSPVWIETLVGFDELYEREFSQEAVMIKQQSFILEALGNINKNIVTASKNAARRRR